MKAKVKDINFLPERLVLARKRRKQRIEISLFGVLVLMMIGMAIWLPFYINGYYQKELDKISQQIIKLEPAKPHYQEKEAAQLDLHNKELALQDMEKKQLKITELLQDINKILPSDCFVTALNVKAKEDFSMEVITNNPVETAQVLVGLRGLNLFKKVELAGTGDIPFTEGPHPVKFTLKFIGASEQKQEEVKSETSERQTLEETLQKAKDMVKTAK